MSRKLSKSLFRLTLVLFLLEVITFPFVVKFTYSGSSNAADRLLTYKPGDLYWDDDKEIRADGTAVLSLFNKKYKNINADNGDNLLAPGMEAESIVRLKNDAPNEIEFIAVCYQMKSDEDLNLRTKILGNGLVETDEYPSSEKYPDDKVVHAVKGKLDAKKLQDLDVNVFWDFEKNDLADALDTTYGDKSAGGNPANVQIGLIVYVFDDQKGPNPIPPGTGDNTPLIIYSIVLGLSGIFLFFLFMERRRQDKKEEQARLFAEEMQIEQ